MALANSMKKAINHTVVCSWWVNILLFDQIKKHCGNKMQLREMTLADFIVGEQSHDNYKSWMLLFVFIFKKYVCSFQGLMNHDPITSETGYMCSSI